MSPNLKTLFSSFTVEPKGKRLHSITSYNGKKNYFVHRLTWWSSSLQVMVAIVSIFVLFILSSTNGFIGIWVALTIYMSLRAFAGFWRYVLQILVHTSMLTHTKFSHARTDHFAMELQDRDRNRTLGIPTGVNGRWFTQLEVQEFLCFHCCMISTWLLEIFYLEMFEEISDYLVTWRAIIQGENVPVTYNTRGIFNEILCNAFCFTTKLRRVFSRKDNIFSVYIFFIQLQPNKCLHSQIESEGLCNSNGTIFASF